MTADRIAFVCPRFAEGGTVGGAETLLRNLARHAMQAGREVHFLTTCARDHVTWKNVLPPGTRSFDGLSVTFFPVDETLDLARYLGAQNRICSGRTVDPAEAEAWLANSVNSPELLAHLRDSADAYDRVVLGPYLFGLVHDAALVHPAKSVLVPCLHDEPFAYLDCFRHLFRSVRGFMFNATAEQELARRLYDIDTADSAIVGMGMTAFDADPAAFASRHGIRTPYVIYCGRREPMKGTPILLEYLAAFRARTGIDIKLVLTGSGEIDPPSDLRGHIIDVGFVAEQEKWNAMAGAVAFCHPSVYESFGIVLMESWQAGTPVLVHAGGDVLKAQCAASGGGLWFRRYPEFEDELLLLLNDDGLRRRMGASGRAYVRRDYNWDSVTARMLDALDR